MFNEQNSSISTFSQTHKLPIKFMNKKFCKSYHKIIAKMINARSLSTNAIARHHQLATSSFPVHNYTGKHSDTSSLSSKVAKQLGRAPVKVSRPHSHIYINSGRWSAEERYLFLVGLIYHVCTNYTFASFCFGK